MYNNYGKAMTRQGIQYMRVDVIFLRYKKFNDTMSKSRRNICTRMKIDSTILTRNVIQPTRKEKNKVQKL